MPHIFISYSRRDIDFVQQIVEALKAEDLDIWIDWNSIPKGEDWEQEIYRGIEEADAFLFLISPDSVSSEMCNREIAHAARNGKRILPIFIANVADREIYAITDQFPHPAQKEEIRRRNFILCREGRDEFDRAMQEIHKAICTDYEWLKHHTRLQVKALEWERAQKERSGLLRGKVLREARERVEGVNKSADPQPTDLQRQYLLASEKDDKRRTRQMRFFTMALSSMAILATTAAGILFDRTPAKVDIVGQGFEIRNRFNYRFLRQEVGSTISISAEPQTLTPGGAYTLIVGTGMDGKRPGTVLAYDMKGNIQWEYTVRDDPYHGPPGNFQIQNILKIDQALGNERSQIIFTAQKSDWFPTELIMLDAEGRLLSSYWNSGFIYDLLLQDFDGDGIKELVVSAVNNNLGYLLVKDEKKHPVTVSLLSPQKDFTGQTFPALIPDWPSQTEYNHWIAVFEPYVVGGVNVRITQQNNEPLVEVVFKPDGGYVWLDALGRILKIGVSDHWQKQQGNKSPSDFICFLESGSEGWYISARTDQDVRCPWFVSR